MEMQDFFHLSLTSWRAALYKLLENKINWLVIWGSSSNKQKKPYFCSVCIQDRSISTGIIYLLKKRKILISSEESVLIFPLVSVDLFMLTHLI